MVINALLSLIQIVVGLMANAFSLVADAMHTLADLTTDALIAWASRRAGAPPDANHPYGHGRLETLASLALGLVLTGVGIGFVWAAALRLQQSDALPPITLPALIVALTVLAVKEGLYHWLKAQSKALAAPVLEAAAWHARSDAASSLVVAVGIGASLAGYPVLEPLAAAIVGFLILSMGIRFAYRAVSELIDTGLPAEQVSALEAAILATPGALAVHELRTRQMGHQWLVDAHVQVAPRVSVSEGHRIADQVMHQLKTRFPQIAQVTIHIDHELDIKPAAPVNPPVVDRDALLSEIRQRLGYPTFPSEWLQIHYLDGRCEIDLMLPSHLPAPLAKLATDNAARQQLTHEMQTAHPCLVAVRWWQELAP
jgi:cation diffusion facilitator family transporter